MSWLLDEAESAEAKVTQAKARAKRLNLDALSETMGDLAPYHCSALIFRRIINITM
jgi:hypothetical protein